MITVVASSVDGYRKVKTFKTIRGARAFAQDRVGVFPMLGRTYAVDPTFGTTKVTVSGATISDLFPEAAAEEAALMMEYPAHYVEGS